MSMTGVAFDHIGFDIIRDFIHHIPAPNVYRRPGGMTVEEFCDQKVADLENKILELGPENVACFVAEPIMGAGGVVVPPPGYHRRTWEVCQKYEVLYISDEVVTAFGRLGHMFASEDVFDIVPDIITTAKGITSGYVPLGACFVSLTHNSQEPLNQRSARCSARDHQGLVAFTLSLQRLVSPDCEPTAKELGLLR